MICNQHPGGPAELPETAFYSSFRGRKSAVCIACTTARDKARKAARAAAKPIPSPESASDSPPVSTARMVKVGKTYLHQDEIRIVDTLQPEKVTIFTSILEIDGETKHPKNKRLIFTRAQWPTEYAAVVAWLAENAHEPAADPSMNEQAALSLADEAMTQLNAVKKENEEFKDKLNKFRALLNGVLT